MSFFRTFDGAEIDLILEKHGEIIPVEIKSSDNPSSLKGLNSFLKDHKAKKTLCVCQTPQKFIRNKILFLPWQDYIQLLNNKELFN